MRAMIAATQKPALVIQAFLGEAKNTASNANAVNAAVYLLRPAKPSSNPVMTQSVIVK